MLDEQARVTISKALRAVKANPVLLEIMKIDEEYFEQIISEFEGEDETLKELKEAYQKYEQSDDSNDFESFIRVCEKVLR